MSWNDTVISEFRAGQQRVADTFDREALLLLHTTGAKSGRERVNPVAWLTIDGAVVIVASAAGADKHPDWYVNLVAQPEVEVERWQHGELQTQPLTAEILADGPERDALWPRVVRLAKGFGDYQAKTDRVIPLIRLHPR